MKIKKYILSLPTFLLIFSKVNAQGLVDNSVMNQYANEFGSSAGYSSSSIGSIVSTIISIVLSLLGIIFLALVLFSGFQWMTAGGNESTIDKAKKRLINSVIGLIIVLAAYIITYFIFNNLPFSGGEIMPEAV